ncbi:MAG: YggS family pyridoxal phosphate-dependent enzyme [Melioribacteraceae bacterium]|nr:YggS family pyridoxal phosphate-dependent enzyme [Melioribacteraceae bacterium]
MSEIIEQAEIDLIKTSVTEIINSIPPEVMLVAASKTRTAEEVQVAIDTGIKTVGYNYVQEAEKIFQIIGNQVQWHLIGHLQKNKVKKAVKIFDMIETIDSVELAEKVDKECKLNNKIMPVLIEINSGEESNKTGVFPEDVEKLIFQIKDLPNIRIKGLMTMGPRFGDPEKSRPYFKITKKAFDSLKVQNIPNVEMKYLSMGMSNSYSIAIKEGANIVRIGTKLFGERCRT